VNHFDPLGIGRAYDETEGDVTVTRTPAGGVVILPASIRRLKGEQLELTAQLQSLVSEIGRLQEFLAEGVEVCRESGLSWGVIGWSVGTTGDAARKRWGV